MNYMYRVYSVLNRSGSLVTCRTYTANCVEYSNTGMAKLNIHPKMVFLALFVLASVSSPALGNKRNDPNDFFLKLRNGFAEKAINITEDMLLPQNVTRVGAEYVCPPSASPTVPESVHLLRPGDFKVIAALGDSLTTAYAAGATSFTPVMFEYPGESASIGGDKELDEIVTLPNIFRQYNTHLYGYSRGISFLYTNPSNKKLNVAESGSTAEDMVDQARTLVEKMKKDSTVDFQNDWKFITMFIGGNDMCSGCIYTESSPEYVINYIKKAVQIIHDEIPRTFLNVLSVPLTNEIVKIRTTSVICELMTSLMCPCALGGSLPENLMYLKAREIQRLLRTTIESGIYDDKDDFAAVYQPFLEDTVLPTTESGKIDTTYFAPDCFHLSQLGQAAQATVNWNSLFVPVGSKMTSYVPGESLDCPSTDFPYLYTNVNSQPGYLAKHESLTRNQIHGAHSKHNATSDIGNYIDP